MKNVEDIYPLSPMQAGMLFHTVQAPESGVYVEQYCCTLHGELDSPVFEQAWRLTVDRHPALRTAFIWDGLDEAMQVVRNTVELPWTHEDWRGHNDSQQDERFERFLKADRRLGLKPEAAPLMRFALLALGRDVTRFVWSFHHLLADGWSTALVVKEVFARYESLLNGTELSHASSRPYRDYISWLQAQDASKSEVFWREYLDGFTTPTTLKIQPSAKARRDTPRSQYEIELSEATTAALSAVARQHRLMPNTLVQGAWAIVLNRYSGQEDVVFGATVAGRPHELDGHENMVGLFINTLPVRVRVSSDVPVVSWLQAVQAEQIEAREHGHTPLVRIQASTAVPSGQRLFDSIVVFENYPLDPALSEERVRLRVSDVQYHEQSNFPLAVLVVPGDRMRIILIAEDGDATAILKHLQIVIEGIVADIQHHVDAIPMLTRSERRQLVVEWNDTSVAPSDEKCWHALFEAQVLRSPDTVAVAYKEQQLTYRALNHAANHLGQRLQALGVGPDVLVGICIDRSVDMIVGILAVLKAGGAYVPLDPAYPRPRIQTMLEDAGVVAVLAQPHLVADLQALAIPVVSVEPPSDDIETLDNNLTSDVGTQHLAYMIYTSGTTGHPRGVRVTHDNLTHSTLARREHYVDPVRCFLLLSSMSFDSSVAGIFWTLADGGTLVIPDRERFLDTRYLAQLIHQHSVSHILCIPSVYQHVLAEGSGALSSLRTVIVAGETCPAELVTTHFDQLSSTRMYNEYGPTEGTVWATVFDCSAAFGSTVPIGRPIARTQAYVLDEQRRPVPIGVAGELYIGGRGIAQGYHNQPQLTAERFVANPFDDSQAKRLYRTGDCVYYREDGVIEFLGRGDHQVKIRGHRIELQEIETALQQHRGVKEAVVVACDVPSAVDANSSAGVDKLLESLRAMDPAEAERLISEACDHTDVAHSDKTSERASSKQHLARSHNETGFEVSVRIKDDGFIGPPRLTQREWLINQALGEWVDDLRHLDTVTRRFVAGADTRLAPFDISQAELDAQSIMEDWQTPVMRAMAQHVTADNGHVLEVGFGRGVSADFIQELGVRTHTVIEPNEYSIQNYYRPWRERHKDRDIRMLQGRWQDVVGDLETYDAIFFHAFPLNEREFVDHVIHSITYAEHFFPTAAAHLRSGGVFTYLTTEIDSFSRRHQRLVFRHFSELTLSVMPLEIPEDTADTWWADSMVIARVQK
jgi:amino acid adenylation domain-containing protein